MEPHLSDPSDPFPIDPGYFSVDGTWHDTPARTHEALVAVMGEPDASAPAWVVEAGTSPPIQHPALIRLEDGTTIDVRASLPPDLPLGYHELHPDDGGPTTRLIVAPASCPLPDGLYSAGLAVQLYAARSATSWGIGDLADLARLGRWGRSLGCGFVLLNPLGAPAPTAGHDASPYYPSSRLFRNPLYLRVEAVPGAGRLGDELSELARAGRALDMDRRIDRSQVWHLKLAALGRIWEGRGAGGDGGTGDVGEGGEFARWRAAQGPTLEQWATYCVLVEQHGAGWRSWPAALQRPDAVEVRAVQAAQASRVSFHAWLQWLVVRQIEAAAAAIPLVQDLPVGFDSGGFDGWAWQDVVAEGVRIGAPPDEFNLAGQDWGLPPFVPHRLRSAGYAPFAETVRAALLGGAGLRIDHVMGLSRLWWIPPGEGPRDGAYVRYRTDEMLAVLALEATRAGAFVVGEDLGTVEDALREQLATRRVLSYRLAWFEPEPPERFPVRAMAAVTTHDLPTVAGLWDGTDVEDQRTAGVEPNEAGTGEIRARIAEWVDADERTTAIDVAERLHRRLATSPAMLVTATLDDALGVHQRPNMPGTTDTWPNWSIALPTALEELERSESVTRVIGALTVGRDPLP